MRRAIHAFLNVLGVLAWLVAYAAMQIVFRLAAIGDRILPDARVGNCWTFTCARVVRLGGYVLMRPVDGTKFLGVGLIPHAGWLESVPPGAVLLQTEPIERYTGRWQFWRLFYFRFRIKSSEGGPPGPWGKN